MGTDILLLHPGAMGVSLGASLRANGHRVSWVSSGRSAHTRGRAEAAGLAETADLRTALAQAEHVISVCPPAAALDLAREVAGHGFRGTYVDANAVSPATARRVAAVIGEGFVDGGIIGPPAARAGETRLYLAGERAALAAGWFTGSVLDARCLDGDAGAASALKMCYAAYTKGSSALLLAIRALADSERVTPALLAEWDLSQPGLAARSAAAAGQTAAKAWRFEGEMREIAATFAGAGLPGGFHEAAAEIYRRMAAFKDCTGEVAIEAAVDRLRAAATGAGES